MRIIDFHTHVYPPAIAKKATESVGDFYNFETHLIGTSDVLIERGKKAGIEHFVILPVAIKPDHVRHINQSILNEMAEHKEFSGFGTVHASMPNLMEELSFIVSSGLLGVKLHPDTQQFPIDDERLFEMYDNMQGRLTLMLHCGDPRYDYSHPRRLKRIMKEFPKLQVVAAHLGGWSLFDEAQEYLRDTDCFVDISSSMMLLEPKQTVKYINGFGTDRVLFGSDFPLWDPVDEVESFLRLPLSDSDREKIAYKNALRILKQD